MKTNVCLDEENQSLKAILSTWPIGELVIWITEMYNCTSPSLLNDETRHWSTQRSIHTKVGTKHSSLFRVFLILFPDLTLKK